MATPDKNDREAELLELLDERDRMEEERKEENKARKDLINQVSHRILVLRRILGGKEAEELPGTGGVHLKKEHKAKGLTSITLRTGDKEVTATPDQLRAGLEELKRRKGSKKFPPGSDLDTPCTVCGKPFGDHAGQKCPKESARG